MGEYLSPGVYVEEVSSGSKPITGVGTSTAAFVGIAEKGPVGEAVLITNWTQFVKNFGGFIENGYLAYAVYQFFNEGGTRCYVVRTVHYDKDKSKSSKPSSAVLNVGDNSLEVRACSDGKWGDSISVAVTEVTAEGTFNLSVKIKEVEVEHFDNLTIENVEDKINGKSLYIIVVDTQQGAGGNNLIAGAGTKSDTNITEPVAGSEPEEPGGGNGETQLTGGDDGITYKQDTTINGTIHTAGTSNIVSSDYIGDSSTENGLYAFDRVDDINLVAIPDAEGIPEVIRGGYTYCENRRDCFFIADSIKGKTPSEILNDKKGLKSSFCAIYYPWIKIIDPIGGRKDVPPSGAIAGIYSSTDVTRGVHKAPAGITEGYINSAVGVERVITKGEHDTLNNPGINVIRQFPGAGICVWGARTLSDDPEWKYVNVRRLLLYIEESIDEGTQWVVFEPNDLSLWGKVRRNITAFLTRVWRDGALFGSTPEEAFFVKVDEENNPPEVREAGQLIIEVGVAPVRPAEFVIIRISQKTLQA